MSPTPINLSVTEPSTSFSSSSSNAKPLKKTPPSKNSSLPFVYTASPDGIDENLLILFHGLGDNPTNFIQFGKKMRLPQTACLAIKAPFPIPFFDEGTSWFSSFDACGELIPLNSPLVETTIQQTRNQISQFMEAEILNKWDVSKVFLLGFSQGGIMALDMVLSCPRLKNCGGVVAISGDIRNNVMCKGDISAPILITIGEKDEAIPPMTLISKVSKLRNTMQNKDFIKLEIVPGKDHSMPKSELEMRKIMSFFSKNLSLRNLKMEAMSGVYEVKMAL